MPPYWVYIQLVGFLFDLKLEFFCNLSFLIFILLLSACCSSDEILKNIFLIKYFKHIEKSETNVMKSMCPNSEIININIIAYFLLVFFFRKPNIKHSYRQLMAMKSTSPSLSPLWKHDHEDIPLSFPSQIYIPKSTYTDSYRHMYVHKL